MDENQFRALMAQFARTHIILKRIAEALEEISKRDYPILITDLVHRAPEGKGKQ